ncbi:MAG: hypothetical protein QNJ36_10410 [Calothrix sp. MO_167.B42]|nr:hypothetical protein [Calothrix sp. MO_167.B42]
MKLIKKSEQALLNKIKELEELESQNIQDDTEDIPEAVIETKPVMDVEAVTPNYIPVRDNPIVQSVGNSGWQISDIWRDIRVDNFCEYEE